MFEMKQVLFLIWVTEECGTKALKEDVKVMSLTQGVERNTMMEIKYDNRIMVTDMNVLFVTQIQGFMFLSFFI